MFRDAIAFIHSNRDCNDFTLGGVLRIRYRYGRTKALPPPLLEELRICVLRFRYWWDEPGADTRCFWTENHQIIFHMDQLLAVRCEGLRVTYDSPSQKRLSLGWTGLLEVAGKETALHDYPRYDNPYCGTVTNAERFTIRHRGASLALDFGRSTRQVG